MSQHTELPVGRYGPPADPRARARRTVWLVALGLAAVAVASWFGLAAGGAPVTWQDVGFAVQGPGMVRVDLEVVRPDPGVAVRCRVQALDESYGQVGLVTIDVPAGTGRVQPVSVDVATVRTATTGLVDACWVPID